MKERKQEFLQEFSLDLSDLAKTELLEGRSHIFPQERPFLGIFLQEEVENLLEKSGITIALHRKGFYHYEIRFDTSKENDHRLWIVDEKSGETLLFMRLHLGSFFTKNLPVDLSELKLLFIDWLLLQNPRAKPSEKLFPGQKYPGLGIFAEVKQFLYYIVRDKKLDGAANLPEFFHDAVLFKDRFLFVHPESQGIFEAILHKFRALGLRKLSNLIYQGKLQISRNKKDFTVFEFRLGEMMVPNCAILEEYFKSNYYEKMRQKAFEETEFILSGDA